MIPIYNWKFVNDWAIKPGKVINQKIVETKMKYHVSKSSSIVTYAKNNTAVKEQRINDNYCNKLLHLRYILMVYENKYQSRILFNKFNLQKRLFQTGTYLNSNFINPWFLTGFADGEGCFIISVYKTKDVKIGWRVILGFVIGLHEKDKVILENIKIYLGIGKIYKLGSNSIQYKIQSFSEI